MNLEYKDYVAGPIDFGADDGTLSGIRDVVHFKGKTADELRQAFRDSIDFYLASCEGHPPRGGFFHAVSVRAGETREREA